MKKSQYFDRFWLFNNLSAEIFSFFSDVGEQSVTQREHQSWSPYIFS